MREPIPPGATLAGMLADGQMDALYTPRVPRGFGEGRVRRLFADLRVSRPSSSRPRPARRT